MSRNERHCEKIKIFQCSVLCNSAQNKSHNIRYNKNVMRNVFMQVEGIKAIYCSVPNQLSYKFVIVNTKHKNQIFQYEGEKSVEQFSVLRSLLKIKKKQISVFCVVIYKEHFNCVKNNKNIYFLHKYLFILCVEIITVSEFMIFLVRHSCNFFGIVHIMLQCIPTHSC